MTRTVMLSTEVLKEKGLWLQAASQFLKLTGEVSAQHMLHASRVSAVSHLSTSHSQSKLASLTLPITLD